jgi:hypothetical protein
MTPAASRWAFSRNLNRPDTVHVRVEWDDGVPVHYQATLANSYGGRRELVHGTEGGVRLAWTKGWDAQGKRCWSGGWTLANGEYKRQKPIREGIDGLPCNGEDVNEISGVRDG